ncbi:MAG: MarR family transcriptional regulator [Bacteroidota bacterium]|nr:MarR family transcriptional regulator [Bacteroidota bacterium]MDP4274913.1 MarR family transcriptional regulator [Bacteroidota bacterium]
MENQNLPVGFIIGGMMKAMFRVLKRRTFELTETKLTIEQFGLLFNIKREGDDIIQKEMADIMGKDPSSMLRMIDSLEKKELIKRVVDTNDRRKNKILITEKGEKTIKQYLKIEMSLSNELINDIPASDLEAFHRVINHIKNKAEKM